MVVLLPQTRRQYILVITVALFVLLFPIHVYTGAGDTILSKHFYLTHAPLHGEIDPGLEAVDPAIRSRVERMQGVCEGQDDFEREYGRTNLRLSRGYEGSHERTRLLLQKIMRGESITISAIGGSITKGHHVEKSEIWFHKLWEWLSDYAKDVEVIEVNGAAPATGSDYFSFCFPLHIPPTSDLILVELGVNDEAIVEHVENMENLLRGLLDLPTKPAVILVEALAFSGGGMGGGGGRMHLPVAQYYDVPVINQRHPLVSHFARHPQLVGPYFTRDWWQNSDTRHINHIGHRDLGMLVASFIKDVACDMFAEPEFVVYPPPPLDVIHSLAAEQPTQSTSPFDASSEEAILAVDQETWPERARFWRENPAEGQEIGELMPGLWLPPTHHGILPRIRVLEGWNPDTAYVVPPFQPTCLSTRSKSPEFNLTPSYTEGWEFWTHPDFLDKPYLIARKPGSTVTFELETKVGIVKMYSLRSRTFGLGIIECWVDDEKDQGVKIDGWWDNGDINIGRFATIRTHLSPGRHTVSCKVLEETSDPGGGHEFRMISMMSV